MIDAHCHLTSARFNPDRSKVIETARRDLEAIILSATHPNQVAEAFGLCDKYPLFLYATLGLHPIFTAEIGDSELEQYLRFIKLNRSRIVGIGEIGLDYHRVTDSHSIGRMREIFAEFLQLAKELQLPVVLHLRNAIDEGLEMVLRSGVEQAMFHCFTGTRLQAEEITSNGYYVSIATNILRSRNIKKAVGKIPLSQVLTETDSPYLGPEKTRNVPQNVSLVIDKLAEIRSLPVEEVNSITSANARRLFNLPKRNAVV
ncbi:MAG: TatD family hydrolase [Dehalococcoidia bacterium]